MDAKRVEQEALSLTSEERAALAQRLLLSLDDMTESDLDQEWLRVAERRARELDRGEMTAIPAEEVRRKVQALLR